VKLYALLYPLLACILIGCSTDKPAETQTDTQDDPHIVGADRDLHGCIRSAGYSWCARTEQCERPWELAAKHGFENTAEAFATFCDETDD